MFRFGNPTHRSITKRGGFVEKEAGGENEDNG
jgi:hypothetical protein